MKKARFEAPLIEGHKGVAAILVPFDPEAVWRQKPTRLAGRRHGWLVKGTANGVAFNGYIGDRWGRFFITLDDELRRAADVSVGDVVLTVVEPTATARAYLQACAQSEMTTQPKKARADSLAFRFASTPAKRRRTPKR
jgi:hypothetical protein